jgi:hypothetical protein
MRSPTIQSFSDGSDVELRSASDWRFHVWMLLLLGVSSVVAGIHYGFLDHAIYHTGAPFTPSVFLMLRGLGQLSGWLPALVGAHWLLGLWLRRVRSPGVVTALAILLSLLIGFYAWFCAALLNFEISVHAR